MGYAQPGYITDNKTIAVASSGHCYFCDNLDNSKIVRMSIVGATASTTTTLAFNQTVNRTITYPDATDTLVGLATTDTLLNKSLKADTCKFIDPNTASKVIAFDASGATASATATIASVATVSRIYTLPDVASDTFLMLAAAQSLTNKTITSSTNTVTADTMRICYSIQLAGTQSITNSTPTTVTIWTGTVVKNVGGITLGSGTTFTVPVAGLYLCVVDTAAWATNSTGLREIYIATSADAIQHGDIVLAASNSANPVTTSCFLNLGASATVTVKVYQNSGGALNFGVNGTDTGTFTLMRVA